MKIRALAALATSSLLLLGCVRSHSLLPSNGATAGQLTHTEAGEGVLWIQYGGKAYSGYYMAEPSRIEHDGHRRSGRVARITLVSPDAEELVCRLQ